jgi:hypothetical protein
MRWRALDAGLLEPDEGRSVIDRPAQTVQDTTEELLSDADRQRAPGVLDEGPDAQSRRVAVRKARDALAAQGYDLGQDRALALAQQQAAVADGEPYADHLD